MCLPSAGLVALGDTWGHSPLDGAGGQEGDCNLGSLQGSCGSAARPDPAACPCWQGLRTPHKQLVTWWHWKVQAAGVGRGTRCLKGHPDPPEDTDPPATRASLALLGGRRLGQIMGWHW